MREWGSISHKWGICVTPFPLCLWDHVLREGQQKDFKNQKLHTVPEKGCFLDMTSLLNVQTHSSRGYVDDLPKDQKCRSMKDGVMMSHPKLMNYWQQMTSKERTVRVLRVYTLEDSLWSKDNPTSIYILASFNQLSSFNKSTWGFGEMARWLKTSTGCSSMGSTFNFQHPHGRSKLSVIPCPGFLIPLHRYICRQNTNVYKNKQIM